MVNKGISSGKIYICDYLTGSSAGAQELSGKTAGEDYICADFAKINDTFDDRKMITPLPGGTTVKIALGYYVNVVQVGCEFLAASLSTVVATLNTWKHYHENETDNTEMYMFIKYNTGLYHPFRDTSGNEKNYSKGTFYTPGVRAGWQAQENMKYEVTFNWWQAF